MLFDSPAGAVPPLGTEEATKSVGLPESTVLSLRAAAPPGCPTPWGRAAPPPARTGGRPRWRREGTLTQLTFESRACGHVAVYMSLLATAIHVPSSKTLPRLGSVNETRRSGNGRSGQKAKNLTCPLLLFIKEGLW